MYDKLQYISQGNTLEEQLYNIQEALENGCQWIQLRFKNKDKEQLLSLAESVKTLCDIYLATLIINDNVLLALEIEADGVHLGLTDMDITEARKILGNDKIIGATANTKEEVIEQIEKGCNYIGLGPYQFTTTKEKLSPIIGLRGYKSILSKLSPEQQEIPVYAIGGITLDDVGQLVKTGVYGIAVSGLITNEENKETLINQLNKKLYAKNFI